MGTEAQFSQCITERGQNKTTSIHFQYQSLDTPVFGVSETKSVLLTLLLVSLGVFHRRGQLRSSNARLGRSADDVGVDAEVESTDIIWKSKHRTICMMLGQVEISLPISCSAG